MNISQLVYPFAVDVVWVVFFCFTCLCVCVAVMNNVTTDDPVHTSWDGEVCTDFWGLQGAVGLLCRRPICNFTKLQIVF